MQFYLSHQNSQKNSVIIFLEYMFVLSPEFLNDMLNLSVNWYVTTTSFKMFIHHSWSPYYHKQ
jgi:hypothetical protein